MAKSEGQKMKLFVLKDILERETDATHGITMARILELLSMRGIKAERKSIYDDLRAFREQDILDVTVPQGQNREYAVASRTFEISELKMMIDAIQSSKFLSEAKTRDLIKKLEGMCSKHEAKELNRQVIIANRVKSISSSTALFRNVDAIHRAITANAKVSFQYFDFDLKKQKHYMKKGERYVVSPWAMIYTDDNYYLLAYTDGKFKHFRVDHMDNTEAMVTMIADVEIASLEREGAEAFAKLDMSAYTKYTFSMFGGETVPVTMVFQNRMMGAVMDRFGRDVVAMKEDERHFRVTVSVAVSNQFYGWVFGLGKAVRIIGPESVKKGMKKALADIAARYED